MTRRPTPIAALMLIISALFSLSLCNVNAADLPPAETVLKASVVNPGPIAYTMWTLKSLDTPRTLTPHAVLSYEVFIPRESVGRNGGIELDGGTLDGLRDDHSAVDQGGEMVRGDAAQAKHIGAWYLRSFDLSAYAGKTFARVKFFSRELQPSVAGFYEAHVRNVRIGDASSSPMVFDPSEITAAVRNMAVVNSIAAKPKPFISLSPILMPGAKLIVDRPWGTSGVTPAPRALTDDLREITITAEVKAVGVPSLNGAVILRYDRPQIIPDGAYLQYDMRIDPDSVGTSGGFDLESVPRTWLTLRDTRGTVDQNGVSVHAANSVPEAVGKWWRRRFSLESAAGKPFQLALLSAEFTPQRTGFYKASYRNIRIVDASGLVYWSFYPAQGQLAAKVPFDGQSGGNVSAQGLVGASLTPSSYVIGAGDKLNLTVTVHNYDPSASQTVTVEGVRLTGASSIPLAKPMTFTLPGGETKEIVLAATRIPVGNYEAVADLRVGGDVATVRSASFAVTTGSAALPGPREYLGKGNMAWGADIAGYASVDTLAELRQNGGNFVNLFVSWGRIETAPGVYDFSPIDSAVAGAKQAHLRAEVIFITDEKSFPRWLKSEAMLDQTGKPGEIFALSYYAPTGRPEYMKLIAAVTQRYKANETIVGYQFIPGGWNDGFFYRPSRKTDGLYDYSPWSQAAFRGYVRDTLHLTLPQASHRYGTLLATWDDLKQPVYAGGVDLRPIWWDFQNFRCWTVENMWDEVCRTVRANDPSKMIELMYGGDQGATGQIANDYDAGARIARKYGASIHNTCYEGYTAAPLVGTYTREWGVTHTCETAGTPASIPNHQQGMFNVLKYGAKGYCWIGGRPFGYYPSFAKLGPVARELSDAKPFGKRLGVLQSVSVVQCNLSRVRINSAPIDSYKFAHNSGLTADLYTDRSFMRDGHKLDPREIGVVLDNADLVLAREAADAMVRYVRAGGTLITHALSGRYTPGAPDELSYLITALGYRKAGGPSFANGLAPASFEGALAGQTLDLFNVATLADLPDGARTLASFRNGDVAVASWKLGAGNVVLIGGAPNYADPATVKAMTALLASLGVVPQATATGGVVTATLSAGATRYVLLHNQSAGEVKTTVTTPGLTGTVRAFDLANRKALPVRDGAAWSRGVELSLAPYEVTAIALDSVSAPVRSFPDLEYPLPGSADAATSQDGGSASAVAYKPVDTWLVAGPFANPGGYKGASFYQPRQPEASWVQGASFTDGGQPIAWRTVHAVDGELRLSSTLGFASDQIAYAMTDLVASKDCVVRIRCGVDYAMYLWLNGKPLFDSNATGSRGAPTPGEFTIEAPLHAGRNRLAAKVAPGSLGWAMWMQVGALDGASVRAEMAR
ncbi:MAG TPA: beta-galactosidase [Capsulimonadaceae bacterium]|jgi:hypothetical protein